MFDFVLKYSETFSQDKYKEQSSDKIKYLSNCDYSVNYFTDKRFKGVLYAWDESFQCHKTKNDITLFKTGRCYPNFLLESLIGNSKELDIDDLINLYEKYNTKIIEYVKGIFHLVIYDKHINKIFAFVSRSGLYKLFYYQKEGELILSTTLDSIAKDSSYAGSINKIAMLEQCIFGYPLDHLSLLDDILILDNHSFLSFDCKSNEFETIKYYKMEKLLLDKPEMNWNETYQLTPSIFNRVVDQYTSNSEKISSAFTAGFDSRTILSRTIRHKDRMLYYSYGATEEGSEVRVPMKISKKLNLNYQWIKLQKEFVENYDFFANQLLFFTDGSGNVRRSHHMFSHKQLSSFARLNLMGYGGSELLRPNNDMNTGILAPMVEIVYKTKLSKDSIVKAIPETLPLINDEFYLKYKAELIEHIYKSLQQYMLYDLAYLNLYLFTIKYSFSTFFSQEVHAARIHDNVLNPYIDDDFIEFILKTPVPFSNEHAFERNAKDLRTGQLFYLPILEKNYPALAKFKTGRGYSPKQLKSLFYPFNIALPYFVHRFRNKVWKKHANYHASLWNQKTYQENVQLCKSENNIFKSIHLLNPNPADYSLKKFLSGYMKSR